MKEKEQKTPKPREKRMTTGRRREKKCECRTRKTERGGTRRTARLNDVYNVYTATIHKRRRAATVESGLAGVCHRDDREGKCTIVSEREHSRGK